MCCANSTLNPTCRWKPLAVMMHKNKVGRYYSNKKALATSVNKGYALNHLGSPTKTPKLEG